MRIRAPEEFIDGGVSNNFRPTNVDVSAATSLVREARTSLREIGDIVDTAHDNALRSQALADSVEYETRLTALRAEMDNEAPPDGTDETDWARTYPQRWEQRASAIREDVSRRRGRRSNAYLRYFDERATQIAGREQNGAIERSQVAVIDIARGAGQELLATYAAGAVNPDLPATAEGDAPSRARYVQQYIEYAREQARAGIWSHQYASEQITQLNTEVQRFEETEGRYNEARTIADRIRTEHPNDRQAQIEAAAQIENPRVREMASQFIVTDNARIDDARNGDINRARSRIETLINQFGAGWERHAAQSDVDLIKSDRGAWTDIQQQLAALADPTGSTGASRSLNSARTRTMFEYMAEAPASSDPNEPNFSAIFRGLPLNSPLNAEQADALATIIPGIEEGDVVSEALTREDYMAVVDLQRTVNSGVTPTGTLVLTREVDDVVAYATANGLADFNLEDDTGARRVRLNQFRGFVSVILRDQFESGGYRNLTPDEINSIVRLALSRAGNNGQGTNSTPLYRRRTSNRVTIDQIPAATAARLHRGLTTAQLAGKSQEQIDALIVDAYARENQQRAQARN
jgi:hypothetical protein